MLIMLSGLVLTFFVLHLCSHRGRNRGFRSPESVCRTNKQGDCEELPNRSPLLVERAELPYCTLSESSIQPKGRRPFAQRHQQLRIAPCLHKYNNWRSANYFLLRTRPIHSSAIHPYDFIHMADDSHPTVKRQAQIRHRAIPSYSRTPQPPCTPSHAAPR